MACSANSLVAPYALSGRNGEFSCAGRGPGSPCTETTDAHDDFGVHGRCLCVKRIERAAHPGPWMAGDENHGKRRSRRRHEGATLCSTRGGFNRCCVADDQSPREVHHLPGSRLGRVVPTMIGAMYAQ
jgi:hypothetical protein